MPGNRAYHANKIKPAPRGAGFYVQKRLSGMQPRSLYTIVDIGYLDQGILLVGAAFLHNSKHANHAVHRNYEIKRNGQVEQTIRIIV